ncbi:MAG: TerB family tellurite resistance protein [Reinekea sp.]|jgi:uncharacterized tellurite resistance protein B-like protein
MLDRILAFFSAQEPEEETLSVDEAAAVLLIEVMLADFEMDSRERECVSQILSRRLNSPQTEVDRCLSVAMERQDQSSDLYQFVRIINETYGEQQRYDLLVDLWRVAFADGQLDKYEDHRIRRICEMLHLHHSHFIKAKSEGMNA